MGSLVRTFELVMIVLVVGHGFERAAEWKRPGMYSSYEGGNQGAWWKWK
jgi:hypothetical protein